MKFSFSTKGWHDISFEEFCSAAEYFKFEGIEPHNINNATFSEKSGVFHEYSAAATLRMLYDRGLSLPCIDVINDIASEEQFDGAIAEIEGVAGLSNAAGAELAELIGIKTASKGIKVAFEDDTIVTDVIINVCYGSSIVAVAREVQEKILSTVQSVTGIEKAVVNVHVAGISFEK